MTGRLHIKEGRGPCEVHDWQLEDFRDRFVQILRDRHENGGLNVCAECIARVRLAIKSAKKSEGR